MLRYNLYVSFFLFFFYYLRWSRAQKVPCQAHSRLQYSPNDKHDLSFFRVAWQSRSHESVVSLIPEWGNLSSCRHKTWQRNYHQDDTKFAAIYLLLSREKSEKIAMKMKYTYNKTLYHTIPYSFIDCNNNFKRRLFIWFIKPLFCRFRTFLTWCDICLLVPWLFCSFVV